MAAPFVLRLRSGIHRSGGGKKDEPIYLASDGTHTIQKGNARQFFSQEEKDNFLRNLPTPNPEGRIPDVVEEPAGP